ncbi:DUF3179 domain-containing protein [Haloglomus litoreum]|uniref:DUF3179 domain-containing protein n=1 Tax=Haloglomus litoreum TaxID=3034026 RepID=UPI0023E8EA65|nr:DUF3179 domain-containing protein [Haloglomus sp. DT116]
MSTRRRYLAGLGVAASGALAGCTSGSRFGRDSDGGDVDQGGGQSPGGDRTTVAGRSLPIPRSDLQRGAATDAIPAIIDPVFGEDWSGYSSDLYGESRLSADDTVVGIERGGEARAYPLKVLNWHEIVNDAFDGPLLVTYCPLCGSAVTAVRTVNGEETTFGVSGLLFRNDLVMYDEATDSLWSQIAATAINGPATGTTLQLVPSSLTTWGEWQASHPDSVVLRPPPESGTVREDGGVRNYAKDPYAGYAVSSAIGISGRRFQDDRLHPKTTVVGVTNGQEAVAYPLPAVQRAGVVNDTVGDLPVVMAATEAGTLVAYSRRVEDEALVFGRADADHLRAGGSRWRLTTGAAVDGPHEGTVLTQANDSSPMFFFAWRDFNDETTVYGAEGVETTENSSGS